MINRAMWEILTCEDDVCNTHMLFYLSGAFTLENFKQMGYAPLQLAQICTLCSIFEILWYYNWS